MRLAGLPVARPRVFVVLLFALAVALDVFEAWALRGRWWGWLPNTLRCVEDFSRFGDVVIAAAAAVLAGTARRSGLSLWGATSVRRRAAQVAAVIAGCAGPVWAAHLLVGSVLLAMTVTRGSWTGGGWWIPLALANGPALSIAWAVAGCLLGLRLPRVIATVTAAIAPYALVTLFDLSLAETPAEILQYAGSTHFFWIRTEEVALVLRWATTTAIAVWGWLVLARRGTRRRTVAAVTTSATLALAFLTGARTVDIPGAQDVVCAGTAPRICLPRPYEATRATYTQMIRPAWQALPTPLRQPTLNSATADGAPDARHAIIAGPTDGVQALSLAPKTMDSIAALGAVAWPQLGGGCESDGQTAAASSVFKVWWLHRFHIPTDGSGPLGTNVEMLSDYPAALDQAERLDRMTPAQRDAWTAHAIRTGNHCKPATARTP